MGHALARRIALLSTALCLAAALLFARHQAQAPLPAPPAAEPGAASAAAAAPGAAAFRRRCAACHDAGELAADLAASRDPERAAADLIELLVDHGAGTAREDLDVAVWLFDPNGAASGAR